MSVVVSIPISLDVDAKTLATSPDLIDQLAKHVQRIVAAAMSHTAARGHTGEPQLAPSTVTWDGAGLSELSDVGRAAAETRLIQAVTAASRAALASRARDHKGAGDVAAVRFSEPWLNFRATPRAFFTLLGTLTSEEDNRDTVYVDLLDTPAECRATRIRTEGMMFVDELRQLVGAQLDPQYVTRNFYFALVWHPLGLKKVIDLDPKALAPLAGAHLSQPTVIDRLLYVHPSSDMVLAVIALPMIDISTATQPAEEEDRRITVRELAPIVDADMFVKATGAKWADYVREWGTDVLDVILTPFVITKPQRGITLRALYSDRARPEVGSGGLQLGNLLLLTRDTVKLLPSLALERFSDTATLALHNVDVDGEWQPSWRGAYLSAPLPLELQKIAAARFRPEGRRIAALIVPLLRDPPVSVQFRLESIIKGEIGMGRYGDISETGELFGFVLEQLDEIEPKGTWAATLYELVDNTGYYDLYELLVRLGNASMYAGSPMVRRATQRIEQRRVSARDHLYQPGRVKIDKDWWLEKDDIVGKHNSMYLAKKEGQRLKKSSEAKLSGWIWEAAKTVIQRVVDQNREISKDQFSKEVLEEVEKKITADDVETITIERSVKLIDVTEKDDSGVKRHFVKFYWVERIVGEQTWDQAEIVKDEHGNPIVNEWEDGRFEELLFMWSYARSSVVIIAFAKGVTYLAVFVVAAEVGVFALFPHALGFMAFNVLIYIGKAVFYGGEFTIDGLALEAVKGFAVGAGFGGIAPVGKFIGEWAAEKIGAETIGRLIAGWLVERAVSGAIIGAATSVLMTFVNDVVMVLIGAKPGFSSWREYLAAAGEGAKWGIVFEFAADAFSVIGKLDSFKAVSGAIKRAGWSAKKWRAELASARQKMRSWFTEVAGKVKGGRLQELLSAVDNMFRDLGALVLDEAKQGLLRRIITLSKTELSALGELGLDKFLDAVDASQAEGILRALAKNPAGAAQYLEALGALDEKVVAILANKGQLAALAESTHLITMLGTRPIVALRLLEMMAIDVVAAEQFLTELSTLDPIRQELGIQLFNNATKPLPARLLSRALRYPKLANLHLPDLLRKIDALALPEAALDELLGTLEHVDWTRLEAINTSELRSFAGSAELREFLRSGGDALDLLEAVKHDTAAAERILAETKNMSAADRASRIAALKARRQLIAHGEQELVAAQARGELARSAYHGTSSDALPGLAATHGKIVPAADLPKYGVTPSTGEGSAFSSAGAKTFVSVGVGEAGLGTSTAYADVVQSVGKYNAKLIPLSELEAEETRLKAILRDFQHPKPGFYTGPRIEKGQFADRLQEVQKELKRREALPPGDPGRLGGAANVDNYPLLFEFDPHGLSPDLRPDVPTVGTLAGEASVHGEIDLPTRVKRVYVPAARVGDARAQLTKILGRDVEVLPLEAIDVLPGAGATAMTRQATRELLDALWSDFQRAESGYLNAAARKARYRKPKI